MFVIQYGACNYAPGGNCLTRWRNLILDSVRSFGYKRPFSKIANPTCERKVP